MKILITCIYYFQYSIENIIVTKKKPFKLRIWYLNMKSVLVTGGAGFIGRNLVSMLLEKKYKVDAIDNFSNSSYENIREFESNNNFKFVYGDLSKSESYHKLSKYDHIYHLAAQVIVQDSIDNPPSSFENNIEATYRLLEWMRLNNPEAKLIVMGTCMVYDTAGETKISESHPVKSASPYAGSKIAAEELSLGYARGLDLDVTVVRPFNTYGPYQKGNMEGGVVNIFCQNFLDGKSLKVYGTGEQTRDLLYIDDCSNFLILAAESVNTKGKVINAGTGVDIKIKDLAKLIAEDKVEIEFVEHHHPQSEIMRLVCDPRLAKELLGWEPKINLEDGISRTKAFLESRS
jgi:UDP-glucose 4-epimerase